MTEARLTFWIPIIITVLVGVISCALTLYTERGRQFVEWPFRKARSAWRGLRLGAQSAAAPDDTLLVHWVEDAFGNHLSQGSLTGRLRIAFLPSSGQAQLDRLEAVLKVDSTAENVTYGGHDGQATVRGSVSTGGLPVTLDGNDWERIVIFTFDGLNRGDAGSIFGSDPDPSLVVRATVGVEGEQRLYKAETGVSF